MAAAVGAAGAAAVPAEVVVAAVGAVGVAVALVQVVVVGVVQLTFFPPPNCLGTILASSWFRVAFRREKNFSQHGCSIFKFL